MLAVFSAISFGVAAGAMIGAFVTGDWLYTITWSVAIAVASLTAVLAGIRSYTRGLRSGASGRPLQAGELALARVESICRTGFSVSDQPQCELVLTVAPRHRAAYTTVHRQIVDIVALAQLQPGSIIVVRRMPRRRTCCSSSRRPRTGVASATPSACAPVLTAPCRSPRRRPHGRRSRRGSPHRRRYRGARGGARSSWR